MSLIQTTKAGSNKGGTTKDINSTSEARIQQNRDIYGHYFNVRISDHHISGTFKDISSNDETQIRNMRDIEGH